MKKILKNYNKSKRLSGTPEGKIGTILGLMDKDRNYLVVGDEVQYGEYRGILLYNHSCNRYGIHFQMTFGEDKYNSESYGKFVEIPMDNGARMEIELISSIN